MSLILSSPLGSRTETGEGKGGGGVWCMANCYVIISFDDQLSLSWDICSNHHSTRNYPMDTVN